MPGAWTLGKGWGLLKKYPANKAVVAPSAVSAAESLFKYDMQALGDQLSSCEEKWQILGLGSGRERC